MQSCWRRRTRQKGTSLGTVYNDHYECLTCNRVFGTFKEFNKHLKKRKHYQGRMLQQNIDDFTEDMQDKYSVDLHDVPLTDFINVISNLNQHEQQDVRRLLLSRAKLKQLSFGR